MFTHIEEKHVFPQLMRENFEGKRTYVTENGDRYPSITTVLGYKIKPAIKAWRKKVGEQEANKISRQSSVRGTKIHGVCEDYLNNMGRDFPKKFDEHKKKFLPWCLFSQLKDKVLCNIDNIYAQEAGLYSTKYKVAGRVDCIAEYNGVL